MLIEDYREKIIKLNESLEFLKYRDKKKETFMVYKRPELIKSWNCLYNNNDNQFVGSTMNKIYYYHQNKEINENSCQKYNKIMNKKLKKEKKENIEFIKTININLFENDKDFSLPKIITPAVKISVVSNFNNKKSTSEIVNGFTRSKRPKQLLLTDLLKINMDIKKALEARHLYFQSSSMSFVPYFK